MVNLIASYHSCEEEKFECIFLRHCRYFPELRFDVTQKKLLWRERPAQKPVELLEDVLALEQQNALQEGHRLGKESAILTKIKELIFDRRPIDLPTALTQLIFSYIALFEPVTKKAAVVSSISTPSPTRQLSWMTQPPITKDIKTPTFTH